MKGTKGDRKEGKSEGRREFSCACVRVRGRMNVERKREFVY